MKKTLACVAIIASAFISVNAYADDLVLTGTAGEVEKVDPNDCKTLASLLADAAEKLRACHARCIAQVIRPPEGPGSIPKSVAVVDADLVIAGDDVRRPPRNTTPRTPKSPANLCNAMPNKKNDRGHQIGGCQSDYWAYGAARARLILCTGEGFEEPVW